MPSAFIIKGLHIFEDSHSGLVLVFEDAILRETFVFERGKETLAESIVVTISLSAHALSPAHCVEFSTHLPAGILTAAI